MGVAKSREITRVTGTAHQARIRPRLPSHGARDGQSGAQLRVLPALEPRPRTFMQTTFDALRAFARRRRRRPLERSWKPALLTGGDTKSSAEMLTTGKREHALVVLRAKQDTGPREAVFVIIGGRYVGAESTCPAQGVPPAGEPGRNGTWLISRCDPRQSSLGRHAHAPSMPFEHSYESGGARPGRRNGKVFRCAAGAQE